MMRTRLQALLSGLRCLADAIYRHADPRTGIQEPNPKNEMHARALGSTGNSYFLHMTLSPSLLHPSLLTKSVQWPGWDAAHRDKRLFADLTWEINLIPARNEELRTHD